MDGCRQWQVHSACALSQPVQQLCSSDLCVAEPELIRLAVKQNTLAWAQNCANVAT